MEYFGERNHVRQIAQDLEVKRCLAERQFSEHFQLDLDLFNNILRVIREPNLCAHKN